MSDAIQARILGPLEIDVAGARIEIRGGKQRELLAVLLIHAGDVVSADAIIDALWGESPPPSALKTLQALVSRLRSSLGAASGSVETHGHGYRLNLEPERLDATAFRAGLEDGRRALARGEASAAAELLRDALALWRGPALVEFRYEDFAQSEIARLDELRLAALEERVEADLALGRHDELVVELEGLVAEHPLRERLRGQLMLALYRSGRQAEALAAYDDGRRTLAEELGLEPSEKLQQLQRHILDHDPALAGPEPVRRPRVTHRSRVPLLAAAVGALVLAVAAAAAVQRGLGGDEQVESARAVALDSESGDVVASVPLGTAPGTVAIGEGSVWVLDSDDKTISQIDPESHKVVRTFSTSSTPTDIAVGADAVWVGNAGDPDKDGVLPHSVSRLDPESGLVMATIELPRAKGPVLWVFAAGGRRLAVSPEAVWVINPDLSVSRIDPRSNRIVARIRGVKAQDIAVGEGDVWIVEQDNRVTEIDTGSNTAARRVTVAADLLGPLAVGGGAVWVTDVLAGKLWRISGKKRTAIALDPWIGGVSFGAGAVWVANEIADTVYRLDPTTSRPVRVDGLSSPRGVAAADGAVWVTTAAPLSRAAALPDSVCSDVYFDREGKPDVLLVSDLSLKGASRPYTQPMVDAMRVVLEQRGFEAGPVTVGYQSCDNATAQAGGLDFFRCAANAKAYASNPRVVAVFGSYQSPCSWAQVPITNEAEGGPLAMLSPSNTVGQLTTDDGLYPTGTRSFFRLAARDDLEANAQVELAKKLGHDRVFFLTSEWREYGEFYDASVREAAERLGIEIVGLAVFDHEAESFASLARRIAATRPEAVAIAAVRSSGSGALVRRLHALLEPDVPLLVPDGFRLIDEVVALGPAAERLYVSEYGIANNKLPPRGRQFLDTFAATRGGVAGPDLSASYGAQGAEILLDAIARSDGTRASVLEEIRRTRVENGILGDIAFNAQGDLLEAPFTYYRVRGHRFVPDRVVVVRSPRPDGP